MLSLPILREAAMPSNLSSACKSVLIAMNSTPDTPVSIILITALPPPPPTPMTLMTQGDIALHGSLEDAKRKLLAPSKRQLK